MASRYFLKMTQPDVQEEVHHVPDVLYSKILPISRMSSRRKLAYLKLSFSVLTYVKITLDMK